MAAAVVVAVVVMRWRQASVRGVDLAAVRREGAAAAAAATTTTCGQ